MKVIEVVKILAVVLDTRLSWSTQIAHAASKGNKAALALRRLKGLRLHTVRQLYISTVAPVLDYGSPVWSPLLTERNLGKLEQAQAIGVRAIINAFRMVALLIAEAEACVKPIPIRLEKHTRQFWLNAHTLPAKHPFWVLKTKVTLANKRFVSPLQVIA